MKYMVHATVTVSCWTEVEADSKEDALKIAEERELGDLCHQPFTAGPDECWHIDTDGTPRELYVD